MLKEIKIIGAGLAGTEAAWQLAQGIQARGLDWRIKLYEMRPKVKTPAHHTDNLAELVCSNSLGSEFLTTARGVLIHEMQEFDSLIIRAAKEAKVPAGQALAVDRDLFAKVITEAITNHPCIELIREEYCDDLTKEEGIVIVASGPLTSPHLAENITGLLRSARNDIEFSESPFLHFFDAASPIVSADSIDMDIAFRASRYGKGDEGEGKGDYINCPFYSEEEFQKFYDALMSAERAPLKDFELESMAKQQLPQFCSNSRPAKSVKAELTEPSMMTSQDERNAEVGQKGKAVKFFEGCMPIEAIAERGSQTMCFGPLKPVGLTDPRYPDRRAVAVVQLRQDNVAASLYNIVGFQTNLKWGEQARVFSMIPGLKNLEILRYGVMHQNIFINSPLFLNADMSMRGMGNREKGKGIFFAGQLTGVEGYTESAATGIIAARSILEPDAQPLPQETMMGALSHYISHAEAKHFQPINSNWGLINTQPENLEKQYRKNKKLRQEFLANRALGLIRDSGKYSGKYTGKKLLEIL